MPGAFEFVGWRVNCCPTVAVGLGWPEMVILIKEPDLGRSEAVLSRWSAGFMLAIAQSSRKILICKTS